MLVPSIAPTRHAAPARPARGKPEAPDGDLGPFASAYAAALRRPTRANKASIVKAFYEDPRARLIVEAAVRRYSLPDRLEEIRQEVAFLLHNRFIDTLLQSRGTPQQSYSLLYALSQNACRTLLKTVLTDWARHVSTDDERETEEVEELLEQSTAAWPGRNTFDTKAVEARIDSERAGAELARRLSLLRPRQVNTAPPPTEPSSIPTPLPALQATEVAPLRAQQEPMPVQDVPKPAPPAGSNEHRCTPDTNGSRPVPGASVTAAAEAATPTKRKARAVARIVVQSPPAMPPQPADTPTLDLPAFARLHPAWLGGPYALPVDNLPYICRREVLTLERPVLRNRQGYVDAARARYAKTRVAFDEIKPRLRELEQCAGLAPEDLARTLGMAFSAWYRLTMGVVETISEEAVQKMDETIELSRSQARAARKAPASQPLAWTDLTYVHPRDLCDYWVRLLGLTSASRPEQDLALSTLFGSPSLQRIALGKTEARRPSRRTIGQWRTVEGPRRTISMAQREKLHALVLAALQSRGQEGR
jgi:hypothetical protein